MKYSASSIRELLLGAGYISNTPLANALSIAMRLGRPILLEGDAGVGKTFVAQAMAEALNTKLIRLQCYEGLDASHALYEWNYQRQILAISSAKDGDKKTLNEDDLFDEKYLIKRPLLQAITAIDQCVLLIDEIDRADEEFEAFLLEILSDYQVSIPELGVIEAKMRPITILTSNGVRELSDALRRRCLFHYIEHPDKATELRIIQQKIPECSLSLASEIASVIADLRHEDLKKIPGIAETLDWTAALIGLDISHLGDDVESVYHSLVTVLKTKEDRDVIAMPVFERMMANAS